VYLGDHRILVETKYGAVMYVDSRDESLSPHLIGHGLWEAWVTDAFMRQLASEPRGLVIDVGANVGWFSVLGAQAGRQVVAYEPDARCADLLAETARTNGWEQRLRIRRAAVGAESRVALLRGAPNNAGGAHISDEGVPVDMVTLDEELQGASVCLIKLDIEGYELAALRGAAGLLQHQRPTLFIEHHHESCVEIWGLLESLNYNLSWLGHDGWRQPLASAAEMERVGDAEMLVAVPRRE